MASNILVTKARRCSNTERCLGVSRCCRCSSDWLERYAHKVAARRTTLENAVRRSKKERLSHVEVVGSNPAIGTFTFSEGPGSSVLGPVLGRLVRSPVFCREGRFCDPARRFAFCREPCVSVCSKERKDENEDGMWTEK